MVFRNESQIKAFLLSKCKNALSQAQNKIYAIIKRFLVEFYQDYDPELYDRTNQLLHSLVKSDVIQTATGYKACVYFDLSSIDYIYGAQPSGEQVMSAAAEGWHGADGLLVKSGNTGVSIWNDPMEILNAEAFNILEKMMIDEGIPIKRR